MRYDLGIAAVAAVILGAGLTWRLVAQARRPRGPRLVVVDGGLGTPVRFVAPRPAISGLRRRPF